MANGYKSYSQAPVSGFGDIRAARSDAMTSRMHQDVGLSSNINKVQAEIEKMNRQIKKSKGGNPLISMVLGTINPALGAAYAGLSEGSSMKKKKGIAERFEKKMREGYGRKVGGETVMSAGKLNPFISGGMSTAGKYDYSGGDFLTNMLTSAGKAYTGGQLGGDIFSQIGEPGGWFGPDGKIKSILDKQRTREEDIKSGGYFPGIQRYFR